MLQQGKTLLPPYLFGKLQMKKEIMQVVNRYVRGVDEQHIQMSVRSEANIEMLEMNINLPEER